MIPVVYCEGCKTKIPGSTIYMAKADYQILATRAQEMKTRMDNAVAEAAQLREIRDVAAASAPQVKLLFERIDLLKKDVSAKKITKDALMNAVLTFLHDVGK